MTLVLTARTGHFVIQASDRMVTLRNRQGNYMRDYDAKGNKSLIYLADDGILSLAYTGPAYIGGKTTDHWLADTMRGEDFPQGYHSPTGFVPMRFTASQGYVPGWRRRHDALVHIAEALDEAYCKYALGGRMDISGAGWQIDRGGQARTVAFRLSKSAPNRPATFYYWPRRFMGVTPDGCGSDFVNEDALAQYASAPAPLAKAKALAEVIKRVSQKDPGVGPDALVVVLGPPGHEGSGIAYFTDDYNATDDPMGLDLPRFYSPWVLAPDCTWHPSQAWGVQFELRSWSLDVPINQTDYNGRALILMDPLRSPPDPSGWLLR